MADGGGGLEADPASLEGSDEGGGGVRVAFVTAVRLACSKGDIRAARIHTSFSRSFLETRHFAIPLYTDKL
jgi:hypothetical protein